MIAELEQVLRKWEEKTGHLFELSVKRFAGGQVTIGAFAKRENQVFEVKMLSDDHKELNGKFKSASSLADKLEMLKNPPSINCYVCKAPARKKTTDHYECDQGHSTSTAYIPSPWDMIQLDFSNAIVIREAPLGGRLVGRISIPD